VIAVYVLSDASGPRYVGITKYPRRRYLQHCRVSPNPGCHREKWLNELLLNGALPAMQIVEWTSDWDEAEKRWIHDLREQGCALVNGTAGGRVNVGLVLGPASQKFSLVKRVYRIIEAQLRSKYLSTKAKRRLRLAYLLYHQCVAVNRKRGTLASLETRLSSARFLHAIN
jgi:hypothetical protein